MPAVILVRDGAAVPHIELAQSTKEMDWSELDIRVFASDAKSATGYVCLPSDQKLEEINLSRSGKSFRLNNNPLESQGVRLRIK